MKQIPATTLTKRERQILELIALGHVSKSIGPQIGCSPATVDNYRGRICSKLGATNAAHAVWLGVMQGYLRPPVTT